VAVLKVPIYPKAACALDTRAGVAALSVKDRTIPMAALDSVMLEERRTWPARKYIALILQAIGVVVPAAAALSLPDALEDLELYATDPTGRYCTAAVAAVNFAKVTLLIGPLLCIAGTALWFAGERQRTSHYVVLRYRTGDAIAIEFQQLNEQLKFLLELDSIRASMSTGIVNGRFSSERARASA
jgi:hypothetical protein